jgi:hypothetical protein
MEAPQEGTEFSVGHLSEVVLAEGRIGANGTGKLKQVGP